MMNEELGIKEICKRAWSKQVAIVGRYPPPYGGVGIHLKRLLRYLDEKTDLDFVFYNTGLSIVHHPRVVNVGRSVLWYMKILIQGRHRVVHSHTGTWWARIGLGLLGLLRSYKVVFTAHSYGFCDDFLKGNAVRRWLQKFILRRASAIISVSNTIREELLKIGVSDQVIRVIPAFIPPPSDAGDDKVPAEVKDFCKDRKPVLVACGAFVLRNGQDVYGLEAMTNMMESLLKVHPNAALVIYLGAMLGSDENQFKELVSRIDTGPLKSHILFYRSNQEFYPVLGLADVFLRPTLTDGDAVSIRESLYLGVPVLASDSVRRPEGIITYPVEDTDAFVRALDEMIRNLSAYKERNKYVEMPDNCGKIAQLINEVLDSKWTLRQRRHKR